MCGTLARTYSIEEIRSAYEAIDCASLEAGAPDVHRKISEILSLVNSPSYKKQPLFDRSRSGGGGKGVSTRASAPHEVRRRNASGSGSGGGGHGRCGSTRERASGETIHFRPKYYRDVSSGMHGSKEWRPSAPNPSSTSTRRDCGRFDRPTPFRATRIGCLHEPGLSAVEVERAKVEKEMVTMLNKIAPATYDKLSAKIRETMCVDDPAERESLSVIFIPKMLKIAGSNKSLVDVYVRLYVELYKSNHDEEGRNGIFDTALSKQIETFLADIDTIRAINPQEDYDEYCIECKKNDARRHTSIFLCSLRKHGAIGLKMYLDMIRKLYVKLSCFVREEGNEQKVNEVIDNIQLLLMNSRGADVRSAVASEFADLHLLSQQTCGLEEVRQNREFVSVTNKCIFKCRDICDHFKKNK